MDIINCNELNMKKVLITTVPFGDKNREPLDMLEVAGIEYLINPLGRKLNEEVLMSMVSDFDVIIDGTEKITDVFNQEPYSGKLSEIERCILTAHMGSSSVECRARMEREATEEAVRFLNGKSLTGLVPDHEYEIQCEDREIY